ncbi:eukaryotic translation initiation factor 4B3 [Lycium barbarum]|uniref:eukaryotic translation initiation factor 4B3 n=1 Tax=Lycium barbarum TaxID=112863 RepID=UPI00293EADA8|nr:eukaryotic translation initiation factor 4B3 [Lycium barbarum]
MAATVSAWAKPGAWALDSEEHESELQNEQPPLAAASAAVLSDFPSLSAAATTKTKKKKPQAISLSEFSTYSAAKKSQSQTKTLTPEEALMLPTGPRERTAEELDQSRLGGGFRSYGYDRNGRGSDDTRRQGGFRRDNDREIAPSRADETDDWGAGKKMSSGNGFERRERGERGGFFTDSQSKADESDNWAANKAFVPSSGRRFDRRGSFGSNGSDSDTDKWTKRKEFGSSGGGGAFDSLRERRGGYESTNGGVDSENWGRKREESGGVGVGGGRPKLNLAPRTLPLTEEKQNGNEAVVVAKPKGANPFGAARPREEVLKEKGQDWKEIDQKLESLKVSETSDGGGAPVVKKAWGNPNGNPIFREEKTERSWRKPDRLNEVRPSSAEETVNGAVEETISETAESGGEPQI